MSRDKDETVFNTPYSADSIGRPLNVHRWSTCIQGQALFLRAKLMDHTPTTYIPYCVISHTPMSLPQLGRGGGGEEEGDHGGDEKEKEDGVPNHVDTITISISQR